VQEANGGGGGGDVLIKSGVFDKKFLIFCPF
jgi:hypothetical protein